jgi:hypothetical protein
MQVFQIYRSVTKWQNKGMYETSRFWIHDIRQRDKCVSKNVAYYVYNITTSFHTLQQVAMQMIVEL